MRRYGGATNFPNGGGGSNHAQSLPGHTEVFVVENAGASNDGAAGFLQIKLIRAGAPATTTGAAASISTTSTSTGTGTVVQQLARSQMEAVPAMIEAQVLELRKEFNALATRHALERTEDRARMAEDRVRIAALEAAVAVADDRAVQLGARLADVNKTHAAALADFRTLPALPPAPPLSEDAASGRCDTGHEPEIKATSDHGITLAVPSGRLTFTTAQCTNATDLCRLAEQLRAVLSKFERGGSSRA